MSRWIGPILLQLSFPGAWENTRIHSIAGLLEAGLALVARPSLPLAPPFRLPAGGGEVSLAHHGVLFLDGLPGFPRQLPEVRRQPLEEGLEMTPGRIAAAEFAWGPGPRPAFGRRIGQRSLES